MVISTTPTINLGEVAQLAEASGLDPVQCGFESLPRYHYKEKTMEDLNTQQIRVTVDWPEPPAPIPTEREWFDLFKDIAASLKTQADFVRED